MRDLGEVNIIAWIVCARVENDEGDEGRSKGETPHCELLKTWSVKIESVFKEGESGNLTNFAFLVCCGREDEGEEGDGKGETLLWDVLKVLLNPYLWKGEEGK